MRAGKHQRTAHRGRVRSLRDIRTHGTLPPPAPAKQRVWVFVQRKTLTRYSGALSVTPLAEPAIDLLEEGEGEEIVVLAELTGSRREDIVLSLRGDILTIETRAARGARSYYREVLLPFAAAPGFNHSFNNGVLEIQLKRASQDDAER